MAVERPDEAHHPRAKVSRAVEYQGQAIGDGPEGEAGTRRAPEGYKAE